MPISSPYNFIPLSDTVHTPDWQGASQDVPLADGVSGTFDIEISTKSPTIVGDEKQDDAVNFFTTPDGKLAIPGSSIKGVIRSIVEVATASRITLDDNQFSQRDLLSTKYKQAMRNSKSGWLFWDDKEACWYISPTNESCQTIRYSETTNKNTKSTNTDVEETLEGDYALSIEQEEEAKDRYEIINKALPNNNRIGVNVEIKSGRYLVVSNKLEGSNKQREFLFTQPSDEKIKVSERVYADFILVMSQNQTEVGYEHWAYLKNNNKQGIPVFFQREGKQIKSFGLTRLYRLPYQYRIFDLLGEHNLPSDKLDFASLLFGDISNDNQTTRAIKGRVNFSLAIVKQGKQTYKFEEKHLILASPKPTFYPAYLKQNQANKLNSYHDKNAKIGGFKKYLPHRKIKTSNNQDNTEVATKANVLMNEVTFTTKIRLHNINQIELGALLWALTFGELNENNPYFHSFGMAKPLGYGRCKIKFNISKLQIDNRLSIQEYLNKFYLYLMANNIFNENISTLKACHKLCAAEDEEKLKYLILSVKPKKDEFTTAKKEKQSLNVINSDDEKEWLNTIEKGLQEQLSIYLQEIKDKEMALIKIKEEEQKAIEDKKLEAQIEKSKIAEAERMNNRKPVEILIEDTLEGSLNKSALQELKDNHNLYTNLSDDDQKYLVERIKENEYYKALQGTARKKLRTKLPELPWR